MMKSLIFIILASYAGFCLLLYFMQDKLIFVGHEEDPIGFFIPPPSGYVVEEITFEDSEGLVVWGKLTWRPGKRDPLVIYFGGNAENTYHAVPDVPKYGDAAVLLMSYRGYLNDRRPPSEQALIADALKVYDTVYAQLSMTAPLDGAHSQRPSVFNNFGRDAVFLHGRSLGGGVVSGLARHRKPTGVIFTTPFDSLVSVAKSHYPLVPVDLLLRHRFPSVFNAPHSNSPALFLAAKDDAIIPPHHARKLFDAWAGPKIWREYSQAGHNDIQEAPGYWDTIAAFLKSPPQSAP